ncbi:MAG: 2,3-bisphosphoglycerate-independent phosphoglycerate mutase [Alphaproteobacteria bacterium]|nr:2,3-bisphosphoglycerate-independent phosphoglycerate mutase [Alphaproteobacteria bacterium]MCL2889878.1 2,3-bisphosphoglycerate-independent phosphoglycerate mutase [Alphaproteobacteria bacterium]
MTKPLVLCILDGIGIAPAGAANAVTSARMPFFNKLLKEYPHTKLNASGAAVGLPHGVMGNSEVGHITIGAGRIIDQFQNRFRLELAGGRLPRNPNLKKFITDVRRDRGTVHIVGMMSDAGVHSDIAQSIEIARIILAAGLSIKIHFISDGRDTPPMSADKYIKKLYREFGTEIKSGHVSFGTLIGRYYAMDRNQNWNRTQLAFDAIALGRAEFHAPDIKSALANAYKRGETDEFIKPIAISGGTAITPIDGILFTNYRSDRARQIIELFAAPKTKNIQRPTRYKPPHILGFSQYGPDSDKYCPAMLADVKIANTLGDVLAANGISQLRISETEKYTHATYYMDGERMISYPSEEKILIPSPNVATFDKTPAMSAAKITDDVLARLHAYGVIIINYANGDMIGHTGNMGAAIKSMEALDKELSRLVPAVLAADGTIIITADHGNAEKMRDAHGNAWTAHTTNKVPFIVVGPEYIEQLHGNGGLSDIAPTMLKLLGIKKPREMTGKSLV